MISRLDADVGRVLARLRQHGLERNTIVFFSSDNGPRQEGGTDVAFFDSNGPLRGHKRDMYEGGIRVPMIVRWPEYGMKGTVSDHIGYFGDFFATAAEIAEVPCPAGLDSISFMPSFVVTKCAQKEHAYLYWEFYEQGSAQAIRSGDWKGVIHPLGASSVELYNLRTDLGEMNDVAAQHPKIVGKILAFAREAHVASPLWRPPDPNAPRQGRPAVRRVDDKGRR